MKPLLLIASLAFLLIISCKKKESPAPYPSGMKDTLAKYTGISFTHNTGSNFYYDSVSHTQMQHTTDTSIYRPDTLIVTKLGSDSIRLSGSLIGPSWTAAHYDFATNSAADYTHELSVHSRYQFKFSNGYDSVSCHYWSYSGVSSAQFAQTDVYFNYKKK